MMSSLANESVASLFSIPTSQWTAINQRVGAVFSVESIAPVISKDLPGYMSLLSSSRLWQSTTFNGLISVSGSIAQYADTAITNFTNLNSQVQGISGNSVPINIQNLTLTVLNQLVTDTAPIVVNTTQLSNALKIFLTENQVVDAEIALNKQSLGSFWAPLGAIITTVENAAGTVTGTWKAILDDLNNTVAKEITVTLPFIESLNIDAALVSWQNVKTIASAFPANMANQENYWYTN